eukprot:30067_1
MNEEFLMLFNSSFFFHKMRKQGSFSKDKRTRGNYRYKWRKAMNSCNQHCNVTIKIKRKTLMCLIATFIFIWYLILCHNVLHLARPSLSHIKSTVSYLFALRDYDDVHNPTFVWKFGIAMLSDKHDPMAHILQTSRTDAIYDIDAFANIRNGDVVWIKELQLFDFVHKILPHVDQYFSLIIATNLAWVTPLHYAPRDAHIFEKLMSNSYVLYVYAENYDGSLDDKFDNIEAIPIGFDFHTAFTSPKKGLQMFGHFDTPSRQEHKIKQLLNGDALTKYGDRKLQIYLDHSLNIVDQYSHTKYEQWLKIGNEKFGTDWKSTNHTELLIKLYSERDKYRKMWYRTWVLATIANNPLFYIDKNAYNQYDGFAKRAEYVFSLSPFGNGIDCHRTYEALLFGNIVITQSSPLDKMFIKHDLPIVIINSYKEINQTMLQYWYNKYKDKISLNSANTKYKLTSHYWMSYIRQNALRTISEFA